MWKVNWHFEWTRNISWKIQHLCLKKLVLHQKLIIIQLAQS